MSVSTRIAANPDAGHPRSTRRRGRAGYLARLALAIVIAAVIIFPLYWMVVVALSSRAAS